MSSNVLIPRHLLFIRRFFFFVKKNIYNYLIFESSDERFALNFLFLFFLRVHSEFHRASHEEKRRNKEEKRGKKMLQLVIKCNQFFFSFLFFPPFIFICAVQQRAEKRSRDRCGYNETAVNGYIATDTGLALFSLASSICTT
jgi:hypothetical protein